MSEGKAASGPFHSDASRNLSGRHGAAEQSAEPSLSHWRRTRLPRSGLVQSALCGAPHKAEIGAAWSKRSNEGRDYLSVKLGRSLLHPADLREPVRRGRRRRLLADLVPQPQVQRRVIGAKAPPATRAGPFGPFAPSSDPWPVQGDAEPSGGHRASTRSLARIGPTVRPYAEIPEVPSEQFIHDAARGNTHSRAVGKISLEWVRNWGTQKGTHPLEPES